MTTLSEAINNKLNEIKHNFAIKHCAVNSHQYNKIMSLTYDQVFQLSMLCDDNDYLTHVDNEGCTINHGNVGSQGIRYEFT